jgi:hypothetical protein
MKEIKLTQGQVALVDDEDYEELSRFKWHAFWNKYTKSFYAKRSEGKRPFQKAVYMHREVMRTPKNLDCDHIHHNTLDNRKENLRNVTSSQNSMNRRGAQANNVLGERCISHAGGGFRVQVYAGCKRVYGKTFRSLETAILARDAAIAEFHGEFAVLIPPDG